MKPTRRRVLLALAAAGLAPTVRAVASLAATPVAQPEPIQQLHADGPSGLLGVGASGALWSLPLTATAARRIADGLDAATPLAVGHGRIAARRTDGSLWVLEHGRASGSAKASLAPRAGLLVLPLAVIATLAEGASHRLVRLEPDSTQRWAETARSAESVLPDGRPVQLDFDGHGGGGHLAVLAGPDGERYRHGVLGDAIEATRLIYLERHSLRLQRELSIAAPYVLEDIAPRAVALVGRDGLLSVQSGPNGAQLVLIDADPAAPQRLRVAAAGAPLGRANRWLAPTTDGRHWLAVHTPHIGGVLHAYRQDGQRLLAERIDSDLSNHRIGARELDLGIWRGRWLVLPDQARRRLRVLDATAGWREAGAVALPSALVASTPLADPHSLAVLLDGGQVMTVRLAAAR